MSRSMKIMCALLGVMLIAAVGCESKQEKAQDKMVGLMNDYADALAGIKSNTDFIDAKPKLERIGAKMKDAMNEYKNLPKPSADEQKKLEKKFNDSGEKVSKRIQDQIQRLAKIGVSPIDLMGAMQIDPSVMGD